MRPHLFRGVVMLLAGLGLGLWIANAEALSVYSNDFESGVGAGLTTSFAGGLDTDTTPVGARNFLGRLDGSATLGLSNDTVTLTLLGLPAHSDATVALKLFVIQSWDGNGPAFGPDLWQAGHSGGATNLQDTTFRVVGATPSQCFPSDCPASNLGRTGADEPFNSLGYGFFGDNVYDLSYTFPHSASALVVQFAALGLQGLGDESWGIDNLTVDITPVSTAPPPQRCGLPGLPPCPAPAPASLILLGLGVIGLAGWRLRRL